jgi:hypothetical protein
MGKAEENYKYALKKDKYDPAVRKSVDKKTLSKKDANTVNNIQEMMRKEKEEQRNKASRTVVTSENREEFMKKKLKLADEEKKIMVEDKPHAIFKSGTDEILSHHATQAEADAAYDKLGQKQADYAVGELPEKERKKYGY